MQTIVDNFPGGLTAFDKNHRIVLCNDRHKQLLEYPDELFANGQPTIEQIYRFNARRGEYGPGDLEELVQSRLELARNAVPQTFERQRPNGTYLEVRRTPLAGGGFVTAHFDITERKRDRETIGRLENHDALTGLPNRILFHERIAPASPGSNVAKLWRCIALISTGSKPSMKRWVILPATRC